MVPLRRSLVSELSLVPPRVDAYLAGRSLLPESSSAHLDIPSCEHIVNCLRLLDSFLVHQWPETDDGEPGDGVFSDQDDELASGLVALCVFSENLANGEQYRDIGMFLLMALALDGLLAGTYSR
jgi:hypothetical protein